MKALQLSIFGLILVFFSCKRDEDKCDGCKNPIVSTITDGQNQVVILKKRIDFTKRSEDPISMLDYSYFIVTSKKVGWSSIFYICNEDVLNNLGDIPSEGIQVQFSGDLKELCTQPFSIPENSYNHITLSKIQR